MSAELLVPGRTPTIRQGEDGSFWAVDQFPDVLAVSLELLSEADGRQRGLHVRDDIVDIRLANGRWVYRIAQWQDDGTTAICTIVYREDGVA